MKISFSNHLIFGFSNQLPQETGNLSRVYCFFPKYAFQATAFSSLLFSDLQAVSSFISVLEQRGALCGTNAWRIVFASLYWIGTNSAGLMSTIFSNQNGSLLFISMCRNRCQDVQLRTTPERITSWFFFVEDWEQKSSQASHNVSCSQYRDFGCHSSLFLIHCLWKKRVDSVLTWHISVGSSELLKNNHCIQLASRVSRPHFSRADRTGFYINGYTQWEYRLEKWVEYNQFCYSKFWRHIVYKWRTKFNVGNRQSSSNSWERDLKLIIKANCKWNGNE